MFSENSIVHSSPRKYFGKDVVISCDLKCFKAWGINERPRVQLSNEEDDYEWLADDELGLAPEESPWTEGDQNKPNPSEEGQVHNKWCVRECERSVMTKPGEPIELQDFSVRIFNIPQGQK
ncbi:MAG: hypothetical protein Q7T54_03250 [Candidatus Levybacteria bacterium]|nr:hypothetical protein [Candidatus Levybacteria bacterium]